MYANNTVDKTFHTIGYTDYVIIGGVPTPIKQFVFTYCQN